MVILQFTSTGVRGLVRSRLHASVACIDMHLGWLPIPYAHLKRQGTIIPLKLVVLRPPFGWGASVIYSCLIFYTHAPYSGIA